jgi:predicted nucleic acid-binding Zn ribbon protein
MLFGYECEKCSKRMDADFPVGKAPRTVRCTSCGSTSKRVYEGTSISLKIDGHYARTSTFGEQMKKRNEAAAGRMRGRTAPKLLGYQHADGSVKGV